MPANGVFISWLATDRKRVRDRLSPGSGEVRRRPSQSGLPAATMTRAWQPKRTGHGQPSTQGEALASTAAAPRAAVDQSIATAARSVIHRLAERTGIASKTKKARQGPLSLPAPRRARSNRVRRQSHSARAWKLYVTMGKEQAAQTIQSRPLPNRGPIPIETHIEPLGGMRQRAHADSLNPATGNRPDRLQTDPPRRLQLDLWRGPVAQLDRPAKGFRRHVVQEHDIGPGRQHLGKLLERIHLHLHQQRAMWIIFGELFQESAGRFHGLGRRVEYAVGGRQGQVV